MEKPELQNLTTLESVKAAFRKKATGISEYAPPRLANEITISTAFHQRLETTGSMGREEKRNLELLLWYRHNDESRMDKR
jgi:hypothetical protein